MTAKWRFQESGADWLALLARINLFNCGFELARFARMARLLDSLADEERWFLLNA